MNLLCRIDPPLGINQKILPGPNRVNPKLQEFKCVMYLTVELRVKVGEEVEEAGQFNYSTSFQILPILFSQKAPKRYKI